jgi:glycosyltransferase involved in cell wall biosynthesis
MKITVILCTYNRCQSLKKALESVAASILPPSVEWDVLVVDNNSNDQTRSEIQEFCQRYPGRFCCLFEKQAGKSFALNAGIRDARGDVVAFMDDDVTVDPLWLQNLTTPLNDGQWAGTGGRIRPEKDFSPPDWMLLEGDHSLGPALAAVFDMGDEPCELSRAPYGTNMAFRKSMFEKYGGFRTDLGPRPGGEIRGEDVEFGRRLLAAGEHLYYAPSAVVYHAVPEARLRKEFFLAYWFAYGRTLVRERGSRPGKWGIPRYYFSTAKLGLHAMRWILTWHPGERFFYKCQAWMAAGRVAENYSQSREVDHDNPRAVAH